MIIDKIKILEILNMMVVCFLEHLRDNQMEKRKILLILEMDVDDLLFLQ